MKFAKHFKQIQQPEWQEHYLDYKLLKRQLARWPRQVDTSEQLLAYEPLLERMEHYDMQFFTLLRQQVDRCETFYLTLVQQMEQRYQQATYEDYRASNKRPTAETPRSCTY